MIGVLKQDPLVTHLDLVAQTKQVQKRPIQIRQVSPEGDVPACHVLFLSAALAPQLQAAIIRKVSGKHILLVGDVDGFLDLGGAVRFVLENNNVRLVIAHKAAAREGLTISAKLLQIARVVD